MEVLFFAGWYPSRVFPTNGDFIQRHARAVALSCSVTVIHVVSDPDLRGKQIEVSDRKHGALRELIAYVPQHRGVFKALLFYKAYSKLVSMVGRVDVIHLHHLYPVLLVGVYFSRKWGVPCILTEHWTGFLRGAFAKWTPLLRWLLRWAGRHVDCYCPVTQHLGLQMQKAGFLGFYEPVPNVVYTDLFVPAKEVERWSTFRLLHVSSMKDEHKNVRGILRVVARLDALGVNWELYLVGDDPRRDASYVRELGMDFGRVHFVNDVPQDELVKYFQCSDVLLMFSRFENLPCVILEAFSCGLPVVSTDVGGISEYFPGSFGRLVRSEDEDALFRDLVACLSGECQIASAEEMHAYVQRHFSPQVISERFVAIYHRVLSLRLKS